MHKLFLCLRYLRKRRIAVFGTFAVAMCVALLIVITSLFSSFIDSFQNSTTQIWGQVNILSDSMTLDQYRQMQRQLLADDKIDQVKISLETGGLLYLGRGNTVGVRIVGLDSSQLKETDPFVKGLINPVKTDMIFDLDPGSQERAQNWGTQKRIDANDIQGVVIGIGIVAKPDELTDEYDREAIAKDLANRDEPVFITMGKTSKKADGSMDAKKIQKRCWPTNIVQVGNYTEDTTTIYLPIETVMAMVGQEQPNGQIFANANIQVSSSTTKNIDEVLANTKAVWLNFVRKLYNTQISSKAADAYVQATADLPNVKRFTAELRKQLAVMQTIVGLICMVAALLVLVILMMIVMQKRKDIGIMRAIGASKISVAAIFLNFGAGIGLAGSALGVLLGCWATKNINELEQTLSNLIGSKIWKSGVYMFSEIPNEIQWTAVFWIVIVGIITATFGAVVPAIKAAATNPVETLRYE
ncbi:MAG: ABC transporter permease [Phycisphaerae bacterium]|nr:ABC transporter permease [Phycisphaerae bacterium]